MGNYCIMTKNINLQTEKLPRQRKKFFLGYALTSKEFFDSFLQKTNDIMGLPNFDKTSLTYTWRTDHPLTHNEYVLSYWKDDIPPKVRQLLFTEIKRLWERKTLFTYEELEPDGWFDYGDLD
jgi:hypothetical protein